MCVCVCVCVCARVRMCVCKSVSDSLLVYCPRNGCELSNAFLNVISEIGSKEKRKTNKHKMLTCVCVCVLREAHTSTSDFGVLVLCVVFCGLSFMTHIELMDLLVVSVICYS